MRHDKRNDEYTISMAAPPSAPPEPCQRCGGLIKKPRPVPEHVHLNATDYPVQLRIDQGNAEHQMLALIGEIKATIRQKGYGRCQCRRPVSDCVCRDRRDLCALLQFIAECERHFEVCGLADRIYLDDLDDLTLEFTPPAAMSPKRIGASGGRVGFVCKASVETQYMEADFGTPAGDAEPKRVSSGGDKPEKKKKDKKEKGKKGSTYITSVISSAPMNILTDMLAYLPFPQRTRRRAARRTRRVAKRKRSSHIPQHLQCLTYFSHLICYTQ